jgi:hypothetical protein
MLRHPSGVTLDANGNLYVCDLTCVRKISPAYNGLITTVAGTSVGGYDGDGGAAYFAKVNGVYDVAIDQFDNIYLADAGNNRIRKVSAADGIIRTIAGTGIAGYNGDGIPATAAQLNSPMGITLDESGNAYFTDRMNRRVRKIDAAGIITTIAGTGVKGFSGDGGMADTATLHGPLAIAFNKAGVLYFSDSTRVRCIDASGIISTVAGVATAGYSGDGGAATAAEIKPAAIAFDTSGNMLIAGDGRIRKINAAGVILTIAGTGSGSFNGDGIHPLLANIWLPSGVAVSPSGDIFIGVMGDNRVRMITTGMVDKVDGVMAPDGSMLVYPNPGRGFGNLMVSTPINVQAWITVADATGTTVLEFESPTNRAVALPAAHLPCGAYFISTTIGGQQLTAKWIIE